MSTGEIIQVIGPIVDLRFPEGECPKLMNAIKIEDGEKGINLTLEVEQDIGNNTVRCVALGTTDGLVRGMKARDLGEPITVPIGQQTLGRIFNLLGEPIDGRGELPDPNMRGPIHRRSPNFEEQLPHIYDIGNGFESY